MAAPGGGAGEDTGGSLSATNRVLWLRAGVGVFSDAGSTVANNTDLVQQWKDPAAVQIAAQATSGSRPRRDTNVINGYSVLSTFVSSVNRSMSIPHHSDLDITGSLTIFMCLKVASGSVSLLHKGVSGVAGAYYYYLSAGRPTLDRPWVQAGTASTTSIGTSAFRVIGVRVNGTAVKHWTDGVANGTSTLGAGTGSVQPLGLFKLNGGSADLDAQVAEIGIYNAALSDGDVDTNNAYLGAKHGLF